MLMIIISRSSSKLGQVQKLGHFVKSKKKKLVYTLKGSFFFSASELEVLMVSYCDQSVSVFRRPSSVVRRALSVVHRQQFVLKANSS